MENYQKKTLAIATFVSILVLILLILSMIVLSSCSNEQKEIKELTSLDSSYLRIDSIIKSNPPDFENMYIDSLPNDAFEY